MKRAHRPTHIRVISSDIEKLDHRALGDLDTSGSLFMWLFYLDIKPHIEAIVIVVLSI